MDVQDEASGELDLAGESFRMKHWLASNHGLAGLTDALSRCVSQDVSVDQLRTEASVSQLDHQLTEIGTDTPFITC